MTEPEASPQPSDDVLVRTFAGITTAFCSALVLVGLLGAFVLIPDPTVHVWGLVVGAVLGAVSFVAPVLAIRAQLDGARRRGIRADDGPAVVRTAVFTGIALAEAPALLALVVGVQDGHEIGPLLLAVPVAVVSLVTNVSGPGAVRRHLLTVRMPA